MTDGVDAAGREPAASDGRDWHVEAVELAKAVLQLADDGGMPDSFWQAHSGVTRARDVLGIPEDGRYTHEHLWEKADG